MGEKLVRDKIWDLCPELRDALRHATDSEEHRRFALQKLMEEIGEYLGAETSSARMEELADIYEVISTLARFEQCGINEVRVLASEKRQRRGGFLQGLIWRLP